MRGIIRHLIVVMALVAYWGMAEAQNITNVTAEQVGTTIHIFYDLDRAADISVRMSTNGGETYRVLRQVSGDVGETVGPGHKTIVWNVREEVDSLISDNVVFLVRADANAEAAWREKLRKQQEEEMAIKKAQEKEAKEKEKALEKEERSKAQAIRKEKRRLRMQNMPYSTFFTLNGAYSPLPQWSYGFKVGGVKNAGWFVSVMSNFNFAGWGNPFIDMDNRYYYLTGESKTIRFSAQAGLVVRTCKPLSLLFGVGYGYRTLTFKTDYSWTNGSYQHNSGWFSYPERTYKGVDASFGLLFDIKGFVFSAEAVTTNFRTIEARVGVGYCFPHNQSKKQTVKVVK